MLISHISDLHLGYAQFGLEEREEDIYQSFNEAIDVSIRERVRAVILAGDLFHNPRPCGKAIITLGNGLKKLKENGIAAAFVLGEHDISRVRGNVPLAYLFSYLGFAKRLRLDEPFVVEDCVIFGENKERRNNIDSLIDKLRNAGRVAKQHEGRKKILVLHQGLVDFNKFAGEMNSTDLPPGFDYYALGHYHDHIEKRFDFLGGLLAYPGSLDLTPSEGIKETEKGFIIADLSGQETTTHWIRLEQMRRQFSIRIDCREMENEMARIFETARAASKNGKKPVAKIEVSGISIDSRAVAASLLKLNDHCLHYVWQAIEEERLGATIYDSRPVDMDTELYKLAAKALESDEIARFAISDILPFAADNEASAVLDVVWEAFKTKRFGRAASL